MGKNATGQEVRGREDKGLRGERNGKQVLGKSVKSKSFKLGSEGGVSPAHGVSWVCLWASVFSWHPSMGLVEQGVGAGLGAAVAAWDVEEGRKHTVPIGFRKWKHVLESQPDMLLVILMRNSIISGKKNKKKLHCKWKKAPLSPLQHMIDASKRCGAFIDIHYLTGYDVP